MAYSCNACFEDFETPAKKKTLEGRHLGHPDEDSEDEFVDICPFCESGDIEDIGEIDYDADDENDWGFGE